MNSPVYFLEEDAAITGTVLFGWLLSFPISTKYVTEIPSIHIIRAYDLFFSGYISLQPNSVTCDLLHLTNNLNKILVLKYFYEISI
jgi:hypothetical protein